MGENQSRLFPSPLKWELGLGPLQYSANAVSAMLNVSFMFVITSIIINNT